ncbi:MAG: Gfo/Idh/MocA family oxidoreductase, partial [Pirellulales bacterium]
LGFQDATPDYREVLGDPRVEAVSICAPNHLHHEMATAAARAGKPFWIEKPMGVDAAQSAEIARAALDAGLGGWCLSRVVDPWCDRFGRMTAAVLLSGLGVRDVVGCLSHARGSAALDGQLLRVSGAP